MTILATTSGGGSSVIPSQYQRECWGNTGVILTPGGPGSHANSWAASVSDANRWPPEPWRGDAAVWRGASTHAEPSIAGAVRPLVWKAASPKLPRGALPAWCLLQRSAESDAVKLADFVPLPLVLVMISAWPWHGTARADEHPCPISATRNEKSQKRNKSAAKPQPLLRYSLVPRATEA